MKQHIAGIMAVLVLIPSAVMAQAGKSVVVPAGTPVEARVIEDIDPAAANVGDTIFLTVNKNVVQKGRVVVKKGARIIAEVTKAKEKDYLGQSAEIALAFRSVTAVDTQEIPLSGSTRGEGKDKTIASVGLGVLCCPLFLLMQGEETIINAGRTFVLYTTQPVTVN